MRSSVTRANARFRGPTDTETYTNFFNEINHDIQFLYKTSLGRTVVIDNEEHTEYGHKYQIINNLLSAIDGNKIPSEKTTVPYSDLNRAYGDIENIIKKVNILESELIQWKDL